MFNKSQDADDLPIPEIFSQPVSGTTDVPKIFSLLSPSKYHTKKQDLLPSFPTPAYWEQRKQKQNPLIDLSVFRLAAKSFQKSTPFYHQDIDRADFLKCFLEAKLPTDFMLALYIYDSVVLFLCYLIKSVLHKASVIISIILIARTELGVGPGQNAKILGEFQGAKRVAPVGGSVVVSELYLDQQPVVPTILSVI